MWKNGHWIDAICSNHSAEDRLTFTSNWLAMSGPRYRDLSGEFLKLMVHDKKPAALIRTNGHASFITLDFMSLASVQICLGAQPKSYVTLRVRNDAMKSVRASS